MWNPDPLKAMPTGWITRLTVPVAPQEQESSGSSLMLWSASNIVLQLLHS
jgi:hypothetical protein